VYDQSRTFAASFQELYRVKADATERRSTGEVIFEKPGKMLWTYDNPENNRVVSDGVLMKVYDASQRVIWVRALADSPYAAAFSLFTGKGQLASVFDFDLRPGSALNFPGGYVLAATPKQPTPAYSTVLFFVDTGTSQVRRVTIIDGQGNRNRFDFSNPRFYVAVPPNAFRQTPPPGTVTR
jgi:outer membrane lipoprotein carrier protein